MNSFEAKIQTTLSEELQSIHAHILQVNIGRKCNLSCNHCHVEATPQREEMMSLAVMDAIIHAAPILACELVDITGGAPELHPDLRWFIEKLKHQGKAVQVRTNLVALLEGPDQDLMTFFRDHHVDLAASMPCYLEENVDAQRGEGTHKKSIEALQKLNALGYGVKGELTLNLIYNPGGASLPGSQEELEAAYRKELNERYGIKFSNLLVITNAPIGRFREGLQEDGKLEDYMAQLEEAFNPDTLDSIMCRHQLCVDWDGKIYDCDFNLAIGLQCMSGDKRIQDMSPQETAKLVNRNIITGAHCFACTAGPGSSCGGSLT